MGLAIIMVLLSIGMLFAIKFVFLNPASEVKHDFIIKQTAQNMLNTLLNTNVCKGDETIKSLMIDCFEFNSNVVCDDGSDNSCDYVERKIEWIFDETLDKWRNEYYFKTDINGNSGITIGKVCAGDLKQGKALLPTSLGTLIIRLELCD